MNEKRSLQRSAGESRLKTGRKLHIIHIIHRMLMLMRSTRLALSQPVPLNFRRASLLRTSKSALQRANCTWHNPTDPPPAQVPSESPFIPMPEINPLSRPSEWTPEVPREVPQPPEIEKPTIPRAPEIQPPTETPPVREPQPGVTPLPPQPGPDEPSVPMPSQPFTPDVLPVPMPDITPREVKDACARSATHGLVMPARNHQSTQDKRHEA